jgi:hypothetical protein
MENRDHSNDKVPKLWLAILGARDTGTYISHYTRVSIINNGFHLGRRVLLLRGLSDSIYNPALLHTDTRSIIESPNRNFMSVS